MEISVLNSKLKNSDPEIKHYVSYLQAENAKLHKRIAKLEMEKLTLQNRVRALEIQLKKGPPHRLEVSFIDGAKDHS